jgi:hypothetical protein
MLFKDFGTIWPKTVRWAGQLNPDGILLGDVKPLTPDPSPRSGERGDKTKTACCSSCSGTHKILFPSPRFGERG